MTEDIGDRYQQETKYTPESLGGGRQDWSARPEAYKQYPEAPVVELAPPVAPVALFDEVLRRRTSVRDYADKPITLDQLSYLLWASDGIDRRERGYEFRTAPSAGALYPVETYVIVNDVDGLACGLYHYCARRHALEELKRGDLSKRIARAALGQEQCAVCAVVFVWTAVFARSKWKYRERAYRYIYLDAGHIAQNLALASVALGLGTCQIGALFDDEVNEILGVDGINESVVYMSTVGHPR